MWFCGCHVDGGIAEVGERCVSLREGAAATEESGKGMINAF